MVVFLVFPLITKFTARKQPVKWKETRRRQWPALSLHPPVPWQQLCLAGAEAFLLFMTAREQAVNPPAAIIKPQTPATWLQVIARRWKLQNWRGVDALIKYQGHGVLEAVNR